MIECLGPFHTCHGHAGIDRVRDSPADGRNATAIKLNRRRQWQGQMYVYAAEDYFQDLGGKELFLSGALVMYSIYNKSVQQEMSIQRALDVRSHCDSSRWSPVIGTLSSHDNIFHQTDITLNMHVPTVSLLSFTSQPYGCFH